METGLKFRLVVCYRYGNDDFNILICVYQGYGQRYSYVCEYRNGSGNVNKWTWPDQGVLPKALTLRLVPSVLVVFVILTEKKI